MDDLRAEKAAAAVCIVAVAAMLRFHREPESGGGPPPLAPGSAGMDELWRDAVRSAPSLQQVPKEGMLLDEDPSPFVPRRAVSPQPAAPRRAPAPKETVPAPTPTAESAKVLARRLVPKSFSFFDGASKASTKAFLQLPAPDQARSRAAAADPSNPAPPAAASGQPSPRPWRALSARGASSGE